MTSRPPQRSRKQHHVLQWCRFFTPKPCAYTSSPLDGMARNCIILFFYLHEYARSRNLLCLDPFYSNLLIPEERINIRSELESKPGPLASQATALTTRQWLLRQQRCRLEGLLYDNLSTTGLVIHETQV